MESPYYSSRGYVGLYPATAAFLGTYLADGIYPETIVSLMKRFCVEFGGVGEGKDRLISLHQELTNILSKTPEEQFRLFVEHFNPNYFIDKTHLHWAQFFFWTLLHFTEKEMQMRKEEV